MLTPETTVVAIVAGCLLIPVAHPLVRRSLAAGIQCGLRYPAVWRIPAGLCFAYAVFHVFAQILLKLRTQEDLAEWIGAVKMTGLSGLDAVVLAAWRPALENTGATFTFLTLTFPISVLFAARLLTNWDGLLPQLFRTLRRRFPQGWWLLLVIISVSAVAALIKPITYLFLPEVLALLPHMGVLILALAANAGSLLFELLVGLFLATYIVLLTRIWLRGGSLDPYYHIRLTARRAAGALRWVGIPIGLSFLLVLIPFTAAYLVAAPENVTQGLMFFAEQIGPTSLAVLLIAAAPLPLQMVLHPAPLRLAYARMLCWLRSCPIAITSFLVFAFTLHFALEAPGQAVDFAFGEESAVAVGASCILLPLQGAATGWLLASWVCLYGQSRQPMEEPK